MPYQIKMGSLIIFAKTAAEALAIFEASTRGKSRIAIHDPSGRLMDPEVLRSNLRAGPDAH